MALAAHVKVHALSPSLASLSDNYYFSGFVQFDVPEKLFMMRSKPLLFFGRWQNSQHIKSICAANDRKRNSRWGAIIEV